MAESVNLDRAALAGTIPRDADGVTAVAFAEDGRPLAAADRAGQVQVWTIPAAD
jgi:hypothetical protein